MQCKKAQSIHRYTQFDVPGWAMMRGKWKDGEFYREKAASNVFYNGHNFKLVFPLNKPTAIEDT